MHVLASSKKLSGHFHMVVEFQIDKHFSGLCHIIFANVPLAKASHIAKLSVCVCVCVSVYACVHVCV